MFTLAQSVEDVTRIATENNYTLSGVLLLFILAAGFFGYKAAAKVVVWAGARIDQLLDRGFKHLDTVDSTMASLKDTIGGMGTRLDSMEHKIDDLGEKVHHIDIRMTRHKESA